MCIYAHIERDPGLQLNILLSVLALKKYFLQGKKKEKEKERSAQATKLAHSRYSEKQQVSGQPPYQFPLGLLQQSMAL